ncbi:MAG TPA: signal peptidase II [Rhodanobacteraceae bacterium]|nr:signal peptidase II [Rhodanobacteraceae bacterium]
MVLTPASRPRALAWLVLSLAVVIADQLTKLWALSSLAPYNPQPVIKGFVNWTLAFNTGAAFSFLSSGSGWQRWFFVGLAVAICAALCVWLWRTPRRDWRVAAPLGLIIGGAVGNLIDRVRLGQVTDFIQVYYRAAAWPTFNIADSAITVGAVALIVFGLWPGSRRAI